MRFNDEAKLNFAMEHVLHLEDLYADDWNSDISIHISNLKYELKKEEIRLKMKRKDAKIISGSTRINNA
jgi:hypothetical protein